MDKCRFWTVAVALAAAVSLAASTASAGDWQGKTTTVDGKKVVSNPTQGMKDPRTVDLEQLWRLGGDTDSEDEFFGVITDIDIDAAGNVYVLDSQLSEVKIYTADGQFLRSIGREGEGPGEFRRANRIFFTKDGNVAVVQTFPGKIVLLTKQGDPAGDFPLPQAQDGGFQLLMGADAAGGNIVLYMGLTKLDQEQNRWTRNDALMSVDSSGKKLAEYASKSNEINLANAELDDAKWDTFERRWTVGPHGKVYACESYPDYKISVWNKDGSFDKYITREFTHRKRSADEKEFMTKLMTQMARQIPNCKVGISDMCKDIENIFVRDDGSIWVLNANGARDRGEGVLGVFDVFDKDGRFVRTVSLKGEGDPLKDNYVFVKNRFYVVTSFLSSALAMQGAEGLSDDEDAEPMAIICYKLEGDMLASR